MPPSVVPTAAIDLLVVEDDYMLNRVMALQLRIAGYSVRSTQSGVEALKLIADSIPSVLILDVGLPDICAQDIVSKLRQNPLTSCLPLIIHTTLDLTSEEKSNLKLGVSRFVTKTTAFSDRLDELIAEVLRST